MRARHAPGSELAHAAEVGLLRQAAQLYHAESAVLAAAAVENVVGSNDPDTWRAYKERLAAMLADLKQGGTLLLEEESPLARRIAESELKVRASTTAAKAPNSTPGTL